MNVKTTMSMKMLKQKMEGERRKVNSRPEVHITVQELMLQDDGAISFSTHEFSLEKIRVRAFVEIKGTHKQIIKELGKEAAARSFKKATSFILGKKSSSKSKPPAPQDSPNPDETPPAVAATTKDSERATILGKKGEEEDADEEDGTPKVEVVQTCSVELTLSMAQEAGSEKVKVKIRELDVKENTFTSADMAKKALKNQRIQSLIEGGISKVAAHAFTKKLKKTKAKVRAEAFKKLCCCFTKCLKSSTPEI